MAKYPTTIEEDVKILEQDDGNGELGPVKRNCVIYRKQEKVILLFLKYCAEKKFSELDQMKEDGDEDDDNKFISEETANRDSMYTNSISEHFRFNPNN